MKSEKWRALVTSSESSVLSRSDQGAWSLPSVWTDPSARPAHRAWTSSGSRSGGEPMYLAPWGSLSAALVR